MTDELREKTADSDSLRSMESVHAGVGWGSNPRGPAIIPFGTIFSEIATYGYWMSREIERCLVVYHALTGGKMSEANLNREDRTSCDIDR
jgi:hypothetical protein